MKKLLKKKKSRPFTEDEIARIRETIYTHIEESDAKKPFLQIVDTDLREAISYVKGTGFGSSNDPFVQFLDDTIKVTEKNRETLYIPYEDLSVPSLELISTNSHGVFEQIGTKRSGKPDLEARLQNCRIYNRNTKRFISKDCSPAISDYESFDDYMMDVKSGELKYIEPMLAKEDKNYLKKDDHRIEEMSEEKKDGHRAIMQLGTINRLFSRNVSKTTGWLGENTDNLPHLRDLSMSHLHGTILDGEITSGKDSMSVQSILGALPENAIQYQMENDFARFYVWDILYYKGINVQVMPLWKRKIFLAEVIRDIQFTHRFSYIDFINMYMTEEAENHFMNLVKDYHFSSKSLMDFFWGKIIRTDSYVTLYKQAIEQGKEGIIVKDVEGRYEQKRSPLYTKLKEIKTWDCIIIGLEDSAMYYTGKLSEEETLEDWNYWYHPESDSLVYLDSEADEGEKDSIMMQCDPVTKPFYHGWCGGITLGVWKDGEIVKIGECKGLTEEMQEDLKHNADKYIEEKRVVEVLAQEIIDKETGSLRHPRFGRWRDDKPHQDCDFSSHIER